MSFESWTTEVHSGSPEEVRSGSPEVRSEPQRRTDDDEDDVKDKMADNPEASLA